MARTIRVKLFKFDELSDNAKEKAIEDWRNDSIGRNDYAWTEEVKQSLEAFANIFPVKIKDWSYGGRGEGISFEMTSDYDEIEEMSGWRLATYIWNNYRNELFTGKYYGKLVYTFKDGTPIPKSTEHPVGCRHVTRYSRVMLENACVLTGMWIDDTILGPVYKFLSNPQSNTTFKELMEDCFSEWVKGANENIEDQNSDDYITETIRANEYEFTKDGTMQ